MPVAQAVAALVARELGGSGAPTPLLLPTAEELDAQRLLALTGSLGYSAAARFAIESALLAILAQRRVCSVHELFVSAPASPLALSALLPLELDHAVEAAMSLVAAGFRSLKFKVGRPGRFAEERAAISTVRSGVGPDVRLRFDANGSFALADAPARLAALAEFDPEFIEEPVAAHELLSLANSPIAIALDESLNRADAAAWVTRVSERGLCQALILKPTLLGGFAVCRALAAHGRSLGVDGVVTHCFEGPVGHASACELALALNGTRACGLAPSPTLAVALEHSVPQLVGAWLQPVRRV